MTRSDSTKELSGALAKAQAVMSGARKDSTNPHFKSRYADLESTWDACRDQLTANGLCVLQSPFTTDSGNIGVITILGHTSGAYARGRLVVPPVKFDAQGAGSIITYLRRYSLAAMAGVAPTDDDGEAAVGRPTGQPAYKPVEIKPGAKSAPANEAAQNAEVARGHYNRIVKLTRDAADLTALAEIVTTEGSALAIIKGVSEARYDELMAGFQKREDALRVGEGHVKPMNEEFVP